MAGLWGIPALIMLASMKFAVPHIVTGRVGVGSTGASLCSSLRYRRRLAP